MSSAVDIDDICYSTVAVNNNFFNKDIFIITTVFCHSLLHSRQSMRNSCK